MIAFPSMSAIRVEAPGSVVVSTEDVPCAESDGGDVYTFNLIDAHRCADVEWSSRRYELASPGAFVSLGLPANLQARFIFIQTLKKEEIDVEITHDTQGLTIYPVRGMLILEVPEDDFFSLVRVRGEAVLQFVITGDVP